MQKVIILGALLLTSCAAGETTNCAYRNLVGKSVYGSEVEAVRSSGKEVRILYPDSFLGFEKKPGRVNVIRNNDEIIAVNCG